MLGFFSFPIRKYSVVIIAMLCSAQLCFAAPAQSNATKTVTVTHTKKHVTQKVKTKLKQAPHKKKKTHTTKLKKPVSKKHHVGSHHQGHKKIKKIVVEENDDDEEVVSKNTSKQEPAKTTTVTTTVSESTSSAEPSFVSAIQQRLVNYVYKTVDTLNYSNYKLGGTRFDSTHGVYVLDCSSYVDHLLEQASPNAYFNLVDSTGADKPTTQHYYNFFTDLADDSNYWNKIDEVQQLRAGDILVFRYKNSLGNQTGGHVVVVMDKPIRDTNVFFLRVADSAHSRHSQDTRQRHESGIGIGTMLLKVNPKTGQPSAFAWGVGGYWNKNVNFAMARPISFPNVS